MTRTSKTYLINNNATATTQSQKERLNNFPVNGSEKTVAETISIDALGNQTINRTVVDRAAKKVTTGADLPDSNIDAASISVVNKHVKVTH